MCSLLWRKFAELEKEELYALLKLRADVFILEQRSFFQDMDDQDQAGLHLLWLDREERIIGTLRLLPGAQGRSVTIGRVVLAPSARGRGYGRRMLVAALEETARRWGRPSVHLSAQSAQEKFYAGFGFSRVSDPYDDAGIEHIDMRLDRS
ncbi:GNAT family N-acetyltransferase [Limibacillus halophilus]|uniref:ElaA protein n=1 Tax=Limibacillus halophilus TaxID=1579333 RepID=A0A839SSW6_9PROT|nr:GNAT family N-acetyltransferase [Limibacillus halophilus]MBB3065572.1 ElaA protein [Limibacillus halophilus]